MAIHPHVCQLATMWAGNFVVDDLVIPLDGTNDIPATNVLGSLRQDLRSAAYAAGLLTLTFAPQTIQAGCAVVPTLRLGTAAIVDVAVETISTAAQQIQIRFRTTAGGAAAPPAASTGASLDLAIFRPLPYR